MGNVVVIDGDLNLINQVDGDVDIVCQVDGDSESLIKINKFTYPVYSGITTITPSTETQILMTSEKTVLENIIVDPIPSNYGLITWNGSVLTVS